MSDQANPNFWPFGTSEHIGLGGIPAQEEAKLELHERIRRIWPYLVKVCRREAAKMVKNAQPIMVDDLIQDVAVALVEYDHRWKPDRGKYITFVSLIAHKVASRQREICRVVPAPNLAWAMLQGLKRKAKTNGLKGEQRHRARALQAVLRRQLPYSESKEDHDEEPL